MRPPEAPEHGDARPGTTPPAVSVRPPPALTTLRRRPDFLAAARARKAGEDGLMLQGRERPEGGTGIRVGFTCSKKIGNAVTRNRAKRRLRAVAREVLPTQGRPGWDYVLVGRPGATVSREFRDLRRDLERALAKVHP